MAFFKKSFVFGVISFATMGLVACGESSDSKSDASGVVDIIDESKAELSDGEVVTCDSELEGAVAAIVTGGFRRCEDGAWVKISRAEALDADKILGMGNSDDTSTPTFSSSSTLSSSSLDVSSSSSWSGAIGSTEDSEKGSTDFVVDHEKDMPVCSAKREGKTIYVEELDETFVCLDFEWIKDNVIASSSGTKQSSGSVSEESSSSSSALSSSSWSEAIGSSDSDPVTELYKCPNGLYAETKEECPSSSTPTLSSSSSAPSSSSWTPVGGIGSSNSVDSPVKPDGYYSNSSNCPADLDCKYATNTDYLNREMLTAHKYGEILDTRDGQVYKTIEICDKNDKNCQTWMAQNLNYAPDPETVSSMGDYAWSGCYGDENANCSKYGRLYTWEVAMDNADCAYGKKCNASLKPSTPVRGVCPSGWHLPSHYEFEELINFIDPDFGYNYTTDAYSSTAGKYLKAKSGWNSSGNGSDAYGFSALPDGGRYGGGGFYLGGDYAIFWSSGESSDNYAFSLRLGYSNDDAYLFWYDEYDARSVRCLKDSPDQGGEISSSSSASTLSSSSTLIEDLSSSSSVSTSSSAPSSSSWSEAIGSSNSVDSPVKPSGYYSNSSKCPAGLTCKYATTTEYLNSTKTYGEILDTRDGQVYKTITIGTQTWMAQNLNYNPGDISGMGSYAWSGCYGDVSANCSKYGRLYTWEVAQGVCPSGWHLPTNEDWQKLVKPMATSVDDYTTYWYYNGAGIELKTVEDWRSSSNKGTNASGFSALPAGSRSNNGYFDSAGNFAYFWSASQDENSSSRAYFMRLYYSLENAYMDYYYKYFGYSVRCLQNSN